MTIDERSVRAGDIHLSVRVHRGGDPPVLALHGLASNARWWDLVAARLDNGLIAVDLRGHGLSEKPDAGYDFDTVGADLLALIAELGLDGYVVAGHSWGASVALWVAAHDTRCRGCVCVDGGATNLRAYFGDSWEEAEVRMRPPRIEGLTTAMVRDWMGRSAIAEGSDPDTAAEIMLGNFEPDVAEGTIRPRLHVDRHMQIARHLFELDSEALMAESTCPVRIVPAGDPRHPLEAKREAVARALAVLDGRGSVTWVDGEHDIPVQRPAEVAAAIADFIAALPPR